MSKAAKKFFSPLLRTLQCYTQVYKWGATAVMVAGKKMVIFLLSHPFVSLVVKVLINLTYTC